MGLVALTVDKFIAELGERLASQKVDLSITEAARRWLAQRGYDPRFGARPMARLIETEIARVLADEILFGRLNGGGHVTVDAADDQLRFEYLQGGGLPEGTPQAPAQESEPASK